MVLQYSVRGAVSGDSVKCVSNSPVLGGFINLDPPQNISLKKDPHVGYFVSLKAPRTPASSRRALYFKVSNFSLSETLYSLVQKWKEYYKESNWFLNLYIYSIYNWHFIYVQDISLNLRITVAKLKTNNSRI